MGDEKGSARTGVGFFPPGTPMASDAGIAGLTGPRDTEAVRRSLAAAGYRNEPVVLRTPIDYPRIDVLCNVAADMLTRCGLNVDLQAMDLGTVIQRRASKTALGQGGWNAFVTTLTGADMGSPAIAAATRGNGTNAWSAGQPHPRSSDYATPGWMRRTKPRRSGSRRRFRPRPSPTCHSCRWASSFRRRCKAGRWWTGLRSCRCSGISGGNRQPRRLELLTGVEVQSRGLRRPFFVITLPPKARPQKGGAVAYSSYSCSPAGRINRRRKSVQAGSAP